MRTAPWPMIVAPPTTTKLRAIPPRLLQPRPSAPPRGFIPNIGRRRARRACDLPPWPSSLWLARHRANVSEPSRRDVGGSTAYLIRRRVSLVAVVALVSRLLFPRYTVEDSSEHNRTRPGKRSPAESDRPPSTLL